MGLKFRRHHNNKGLHQIKKGATRKQVERIAKKLRIPTPKTVKEQQNANN